MGSSGRDLFVVITIIVGLFVVWIATGGPERVASRGGLFINPLPPLGSGTTYGDIGGRGGIIPNINTSGGDRDDSRGVAELKRRLTNLRSSADVSPDAGSITIERVEGDESDPSREYVRIRADRRNTQIVNVSGWQFISARTGVRAEIGSGSLLPKTSGSSSGTISLAPGDTAYVVTGRSPIGTSFRLNSCTGYFEQFQDFEPSLPQQCPHPEDEFDEYPGSFDFGDACESFVDRAPRCTTQLTFPLEVTNECRAFFNKRINYNGCVLEHEADRGFYKDEWRVFLGRDSDLWHDTRDAVILLDAQGRAVDTYSYE